MAGYTRQSSATIIAGANVTAAIFNAEFNQLQSAFNGTTGHGHTGGTGDGPKLVLTAAASVSGILPLANGGTGYSTRIDAYDNLHIVASDIAVGSTVDLSTSDGDYIEITGTGGTVTSFGTCDIGVKRTLYFSGASNTITHNGTSLICPNGVNITVKAGEQLVVRSLGSGNWIVELLMKNSSAALGNLVLAANKLPYMSSTTAMSLADFTAFGRSLVDDSDAATARTTLGLGTISTQNSNNVTISGGAITGITDLAVADGGTGASTAANARTNLGLVIGTDVQAYDSGLAALAAFNTNGLLVQTANNTFAGRTLTGTANEITVTNGDGVSGAPTLSLPSALTFTGKTVTGGSFSAPQVITTNVFTGFLSGLTLSNNGSDPTNDIDIAVGAARTVADDYTIILGSGLTKRLDAAWAVGTNQGGLDTGAIANTTYHVWLIRRSDTGVVDALFSTSASSPTMPTNYDQKRRIGSIMRFSATIKAFTQVGDIFKWAAQSADRDAVAGTNDGLYLLTIPGGIQTQPLLHVQIANNTAGTSTIRIADAAYGTTPAGQNASVIAADEVATSYVGGGVLSNTASQIWLTVTGATLASTTIVTTGFIDRRGRD